MSLDPVAPWEAADAFPERPADGYGYTSRGRIHPCSQDELIHRCRRPGVALVWTPETPRLVPPQAVPFLSEALSARAAHQVRSARLMAIFWCLIWGFALARRGHDWPLDLVLLVAMGILPLLATLRRKIPATADAKESEARARYQAWMATRRMPWTTVLAASLVAVTLCQLIVGVGTSVKAAGLVKASVLGGQWWRLLTGPALHGGPLHLIMNLGALLSLGGSMEALAGSACLAPVFLASMLCGSVASVVFLPHKSSVGASGGIVGLLGFLAVLGHRRRRVLPEGFARSLLKGVVWLGLMGYIARDFIDNAAHGGGLVAGALLGLALVPAADGRLPLANPPRLRRLGAVCLAIFVAVALGSCFLVVASGGAEAIGDRFALGRGVTKDARRAVLFYWIAARVGNPSAEGKLAYHLQTGEGVPPDEAEAAKWYRRGAAQGDPYSEAGLGSLYEEGRVERQSDGEAASWYRKAAESGGAWGQFNLGRLYQMGRGVPQDPVQSYVWLTLAARAMRPVPEFAQKLRDEVGRTLTPEQRAAADARVESWRPRLPE
jgi:MYXO-CTERM domain-containing protein